MRQDPRTIEAELPRESPAAVAGRRLFVGAAVTLVAAAGATRVLGIAPRAGLADRPSPLAVQLEAVPREAAERLAGTLVPPARLEETIAALQDRSRYLVRAPFYGVGAGIGRTVRIATGLSARTITLTATPTVVLLPIAVAGQITIEALGPPVLLGLLTTTGPQTLPPIDAGGTLAIEVIVQ